jgi:hypothetical protein
MHCCCVLSFPYQIKAFYLYSSGFGSLKSDRESEFASANNVIPLYWELAIKIGIYLYKCTSCVHFIKSHKGTLMESASSFFFSFGSKGRERCYIPTYDSTTVLFLLFLDISKGSSDSSSPQTRFSTDEEKFLSRC